MPVGFLFIFDSNTHTMPGPGDKLKPGKVSGKKPIPIDRSLFAEALARPINYGDNVISNDIEGLDPGAISGIGHRYYSGSSKGGDLITTNGKDYFMYNKQGNTHGLVNIGSNPFKTTSPTVPVVTAPASTIVSTPSTTIATKQTVDPNYKPMVFGQGQNYNPNTGKYYNPDTGAEITPIVTGGQKQVPMKETGLKKGGLVKNYSAGGFSEDPLAQMTPEEQEEFQFQQAYNEGNAADDAVAAKSKADRQAALAGQKKPMSQADQATLVGVGVQGSEMGASYIDSKNQLSEEGYTDVKKATASGALRGAGKGAGIGAAVGSVIPGVGTGIGAVAGAAIGGVAGGITGNKKAKAFNEEARLGNEEEAAEEKARLARTSIAGALAERNLADGGKVEGPGTGTSDSITKKKIKPGAFVVPAKNAKTAEAIREKVLGDDPDKKADLNQYSGKPNANLSNGEHIFTPEEVKELTAKGIDLDDLAPEAKTKLRNEMNFKKGGPVPQVAKRKYSSGNKQFDKRIDEITAKQYTDIKDINKDLQELNAMQDKYKSLYGEPSQEILLTQQGLHKISPDIEKGTKRKILVNEIDKKISAGRDQLLSSGATAEDLIEFDKGADQYRKSGVDMAFDEAYKNANSKLAGRDAKSASDSDKEMLRTKGLSFYNKKLIDSTKKLEEAKANPGNYTRAQIDEFNKDVQTAKDKILAVNTAIKDGGMPLVNERDTYRRLSGDNPPPVKAPPVKTAVTPPAVITPVEAVAEQPKYKIDPASPEIPNADQINKYKAAQASKTSGVGQSQSAPSVDMADLVKFKAPVTENPLETMQPTQPAPPSGGIANNVVTPVAAPVVADTTTSAPPSAQTDKVGGILSAINGASQYVLPAIQAGMGFKAARELGDRPVDEIDPDYLNMIDEARTGVKVARADAKFGMTPAAKFAAEQDNQNLLNAERYTARSMGGGPANSINLERSAINNSFGRGIRAMLADEQLKLSKQGRADDLNNNLNSMIANKAGMSRQLFGDTLNAYNDDSNAAGALIGSGLNNAIAAGRYNNELEYAKKRDAKYNV